jgi:uncharacterized protein (DUF305 family)
VMLLAVGAASCTEATDDASATPPASVIVPGKPGEQAKVLPADQAAEAIPPAKPAEADFSYVHRMIAHHQQAVELTGLAAERAVREEVRGIAARIADAQQPEISVMTQWLRRNGRDAGDAHHDAANMPGMATPDQLTALRTASGPDFDRLFLQLMVAHHEGAVLMATELLSTGTDVFVEEMANEVIATQSAEIQRMKAMGAG